MFRKIFLEFREIFLEFQEFQIFSSKFRVSQNLHSAVSQRPYVGVEGGGRRVPPCEPSPLTQIVPISASIRNVFRSVFYNSVEWSQGGGGPGRYCPGAPSDHPYSPRPDRRGGTYMWSVGAAGPHAEFVFPLYSFLFCHL